MNLIGKCFKVVKEDTDGIFDVYPELTIGTEFKVLTVDRENSDGITGILIKNETYLHIGFRESSFWCFWEQYTMDEIEEIEEFASDRYKTPNTAHSFKGRDIASQLFKVAGAENCDTEEYDLMQAAGEYIRWLERQLEFSDKASNEN